MPYNSNVIKNTSQVENSKFVEIKNDSRFPAISVTRVNYADASQAFNNNTNTILLSTIDVYPKYGVITYIANTDDFAVSLSAGQVNLDTTQMEIHLSNIDQSTADHTDILQIIEQNTFDTASATDQMFQEIIDISTKASVLTATNFSTSVKQDTQITLEKTLTANSVFGTLSTQPLYIVNTQPLTALSITNLLTSISVNTSSTFPISGSVTVLNPVTQFTTSPQPTQLDAFGRLRISSPMTLFDSSHRYRDNNLWSTLSANGGSVSFNPSQGLMELNVTNTAGASAIRETTKVFSYQPGKSLLVMNTFVMASSATNLRQRVGYFGDQNGIYFQLDDGNISMVERSLVTGSITESVVSRSNWNGDKLDGTGSSGIVLNITKAQILWMDIEWLGLGTVRVGFIINGQFIVCHSFHHANIIDSTYITTASLPLRYEIINKGATVGSRTMKQICSTVISEGGYELRGLQQAVSIPITAPRTFAVAGTFYPIISIRLKTTPDRLDAIVILTALSILGQGNGINYNWQVKASGVTTGGSWVDAGVDSAVEYNITGTSYAGGRILASGFLNASNQASPNLDILKEALFKFQLERNNLTKTPFELTLVAASDTTNGSGMFASMDWEEVSR